MFLSLMRKTAILTFLITTSCLSYADCPKDCSKVLVAKAKPVIHEQIIKKQEKQDDLNVKAEIIMENGKKSEVKCSTKNDTITCEW